MEVNNLKQEMLKKEQSIGKLEAALRDKERIISELNEKVKNQDNKISVLSKQMVDYRNTQTRESTISLTEYKKLQGEL